MTRLIFLLLFTSSAGLLAQQAEPIVFKEKVHDFGTIAEQGGPAEHEFTFVNNSGKVIRILSVQASCGCTTPGWTKEPVSPGEKGSVKASFEPRGRPGFFAKTLTVTTDLSSSALVLQIKGNVVNSEIENDNARLTATSGSFRLRSTAINFGKVFINKPAIQQQVIVYNQGTQAVAITSTAGPAHLRVDAPASVAPGQRGVITVSYDAALKNKYGFAVDNIELVTDDTDVPRKSLSVYATIEEFFPPVAQNELEKVPVLQFDASSMDFGRVQSGSSAERIMTVRNAGKRELVVRAIQPNCTCVSAVLPKMTIKPGEDRELRVTLQGEGRKGTQNKAITVYSTDPVNPVQRIPIIAIVD